VSGRTAIYRLYDANGVLLYIGQTCRPPTVRMREHGKVKSWWDEVATGTIVWVPYEDADTEERRAILAENPRHNHERHPVNHVRHRGSRTWEPIPDDLAKRLARAGRKYRRTRTRADRMAVAALIYEAYVLRCRPAEVRDVSGIMQEEARRWADKYQELNPDLPRIPRREIKRQQSLVA